MHDLTRPRFLVLPGQTPDALTRVFWSSADAVELQHFDGAGLQKVPLDDEQLPAFLRTVPLDLLNAAMQAQIRESANPLFPDDFPQRQVWHFTVAPGVRACGDDSPNSWTTDTWHDVTCLQCLRTIVAWKREGRRSPADAAECLQEWQRLVDAGNIPTLHDPAACDECRQRHGEE